MVVKSKVFAREVQKTGDGRHFVTRKNGGSVNGSEIDENLNV